MSSSIFAVLLFYFQNVICKCCPNFTKLHCFQNVSNAGFSFAAQLKAGYKDDVIGADVTANNASARLSSLQHRPESPLANENSDDSGYRESNDSRIETSSSGSGDSSLPNGKSVCSKSTAINFSCFQSRSKVSLDFQDGESR